MKLLQHGLAGHLAGGNDVAFGIVIPCNALGIGIDETQGKLVYDPGHPDANAEGYVELPNVDIVTEMVDMITASRAYEANVTTINAAKSMAQQALNISK